MGGQKLDALFAQWDVNGDGILNDDEFVTAVRRLVKLTDREVKAVLAVLDEDKNGVVSKDEFFVFVRTDKDVRRPMRCVGELPASGHCMYDNGCGCGCSYVDMGTMDPKHLKPKAQHSYLKRTTLSSQ